jgi:hypothetical protein
MNDLAKFREAEFARQGSGSLTVDAAKGLTGLAGGAVGAARGKGFSESRRKTSDAVGKGLWHGFGKHVDYADRYLGGAASKIPVLGRLFKTKERYEHAFSPEIKNKLGKQVLNPSERHAVTAATEGVNVRRLSAPIKGVAKVAVPIAASMYIGEKMMKHRENKLREQQQQKHAELSVVVQKSVLLKTAGVLRNLDQEKKAALAELAETTKLATAQKAVLSLVKEGLIDLDDIDEKIAELVEHPDRAESFFNVPKTSNFGTLSTSTTSSSNPLEDFLLNGEK